MAMSGDSNERKKDQVLRGRTWSKRGKTCPRKRGKTWSKKEKKDLVQRKDLAQERRERKDLATCGAWERKTKRGKTWS